MNRRTDNQIHRLAVCSDLRRNLILSMIEGKKPLGELRDRLQISSTTAIHALKELEKSSLSSQDNERNYLLTNIGRIIAMSLIDFSNTAEVLEKHEKFWLEHDLSGIPDHLLEKIGWLNESNVIQLDHLDITKSHSAYIGFVKNASWVKGVSPIFSSDYPAIFTDVVKQTPTQLILTKDVLKKLTDVVGSDTLNYLVSNHNLEIFIIEQNPRVAFTVTDNFISLGLFKHDGIYDTTCDLIGTGTKTIEWGLKLFGCYLKKANKWTI